MATVAPDAFLFGYRRIYCEADARAKLASALLKLGISSSQAPDGSFIIREADFKPFRKYAGGRIRYTSTEVLGIGGAVLRLRHYIPTLIAILVCSVVTVLLSGLVWDVRIEGEDKLSESEVREMLCDVGFGIGKRWSEIDTVRVENSVRSKYSDIAWIQINRSGTVAYVTVMERDGGSEGVIPSPSFSNVVADRNGVIEEITVTSGRAEVKPGDVVRKGDILISGIVEDDGGGYMTRAAGTVIARSAGSLSASARRTEYTDTLTDGEKYSLSLEIFGLDVNIYKKYGNLDDGCVIIDDEGEYLEISDKRLPIRIKRQYLSHTVREEQCYTDAELPLLASERLRSALNAALMQYDLIKLSTRGEFTADGYVMTADYVYAAEIGIETEIELSVG